jgi:hypothetical protein
MTVPLKREKGGRDVGGKWWEGGEMGQDGLGEGLLALGLGATIEKERAAPRGG